MKFLGCLASIFLLGLVVLLGVFSTLLGTIMRLLGIHSRTTSQFRSDDGQTAQQDNAPKKVFNDNEGEYIDFEEV